MCWTFICVRDSTIVKHIILLVRDNTSVYILYNNALYAAAGLIELSIDYVMQHEHEKYLEKMRHISATQGTSI